MEYYKHTSKIEDLSINIDHKPLKTLETMHEKKMNRLQLLTIDLDFEIRSETGSEMPENFLAKSKVEQSAISEIDLNWIKPNTKTSQT